MPWLLGQHFDLPQYLVPTVLAKQLKQDNDDKSVTAAHIHTHHARSIVFVCNRTKSAVEHHIPVVCLVPLLEQHLPGTQALLQHTSHMDVIR